MTWPTISQSKKEPIELIPSVYCHLVYKPTHICSHLLLCFWSDDLVRNQFLQVCSKDKNTLPSRAFIPRPSPVGSGSFQKAELSTNITPPCVLLVISHSLLSILQLSSHPMITTPQFTIDLLVADFKGHIAVTAVHALLAAPHTLITLSLAKLSYFALYKTILSKFFS